MGVSERASLIFFQQQWVFFLVSLVRNSEIDAKFSEVVLMQITRQRDEFACAKASVISLPEEVLISAYAQQLKCYLVTTREFLEHRGHIMTVL